MTILLNNGEFLIEILKSYSGDLVVTFLGVFLGFGTALFVDRLSYKRQRKKERLKNEELLLMRMKYLRNSIIEGMDYSEKQAIHCIDSAKRIMENPYDLEVPFLNTSLALFRLKEAANLELFEAYSNFSENDPDYLQNYKAIFDSADFLYFIFEEFKNKHLRHLKFQYEDQAFVRNTLEDMFSIIGIKAVSIERAKKPGYEKDPNYLYLLDLIRIYKEITETTLSFQEVHGKFVQFINNTIYKSMDEIEYVERIFVINKKALSRLYNIKVNSLLYANELESMNESIMPAIDSLTKMVEIIDQKVILTK